MEEGVTERSMDPFGFRQELFATGMADKVKFEFWLVIKKVSEEIHPLTPVTVTM